MRRANDSSPAWIVKVGGSLFDLPQLGPRLQHWLGGLPTRRVVLVPGGGRSADVVRQLDQVHLLGEERAHWLALQALTLNAHFLAALLPRAAVTDRVGHCEELWAEGTLPVLDGLAFAQADEGRPGCLPHSWHVTSDSLAARVAEVAGAGRLLLLKSVSIPRDIDWSEAGRQGFVDPAFAAVLRRASTQLAAALQVEAVNFRT